MSKKFKLIFLISVITVIFATVIIRNYNPFGQQIDEIFVQNGTTGKITVIENDMKNKLIDEIEDSHPHIAGIRSLSSGYDYKIILIKDKKQREIIIKSNDSFFSGIFKYKVDGNLVRIVEKAINE